MAFEINGSIMFLPYIKKGAVKIFVNLIPESGGSFLMWVKSFGWSFIFICFGILKAQNVEPADTVQFTGPSSNRIDLIFLGDGWGQNQGEDQKVFLDSHITTFFEIPVYNRYKNFFNVYRANHFRSNIPSSVQTRTNVQYYVTQTDESAENMDVRYILTHNGGAGEGGNVGMTSARLSITSSDYENLIGPHEMGHAWHRLGDVYAGGGRSSWPNVATIARQKWAHWVGYREFYNRDIVNYFPIEQSSGFRCVRSNFTMMGDVADAGRHIVYSPVAREKVILDIYKFVNPVDSHTPNIGTTTDPDSIRVKTIDPAIFSVDWYLDDSSITLNQEFFVSSERNINPGIYTLKAHVYDNIVSRAYSDRGGIESGTSNGLLSDSLDWVRKDLDSLQQEISWTVRFTKNTVPLATSRASHPNQLINISRGKIKAQNTFPGEFKLSMHRINGEQLLIINGRSEGGEINIEFSQYLKQHRLYSGAYIVMFRQKNNHSKKIIIF